MIPRFATEDDREAVLALGHDMVVELTPWLRFDRARADASYTEALLTYNPTVFVVEDRGEVVGFLVARGTDYAACAGFYVSQDLFYVRPDKRGTRAAASLFTYFVAWARKIHPEEVSAGIGWGRRSAAAARWLRRFGFEPAVQCIARLSIGGKA